MVAIAAGIVVALWTLGAAALQGLVGSIAV